MWGHQERFQKLFSKDFKRFRGQPSKKIKSATKHLDCSCQLNMLTYHPTTVFQVYDLVLCIMEYCDPMTVLQLGCIFIPLSDG